MDNNRPKVSVAAYILNQDNQLLLMLRQNTVGAGTWCPPGGHLEFGEEWIDCVKRECKEEAGLEIIEAKLWAVNNNITLPDKHYINLDFLVSKWNGEAKNTEPEKCAELRWFNLNDLPKPLMVPVYNFFRNNPLCLCQSGKKYFDCHGK